MDDAVDARADERLPPGLVRALRADPDHAPELLMRFAVRRLAADAARWAAQARAAHPELTPAEIAAQIRWRTNLSSLAAGAISGTPFLLALVPAYVSVLWDQAWMALRMAALFGHDVQAPGTTAQLLVLRGVHPTTAEAQAALDALEHRPERRLAGGTKAWWRLGRRFLVLAGFLEPPEDGPPPSRLRRMALWTFAGVLYAITWVIPLTFMIVMAQSCSMSTKRMFVAASHAYDPEGAAGVAPPQRHPVRTLLIAGIAGGVPLAIIAWANNVAQGDAVTWVRSIGALLGLSFVLALYGLSRRPPR